MISKVLKKSFRHIFFHWTLLCTSAEPGILITARKNLPINPKIFFFLSFSSSSFFFFQLGIIFCNCWGQHWSDLHAVSATADRLEDRKSVTAEPGHPAVCGVWQDQLFSHGFLSVTTPGCFPNFPSKPFSPLSEVEIFQSMESQE